MYEIVRDVGSSHVGSDGKLTLSSAIDFMQDCSGFQLDSENLLSRYFRENNITMFLVSRQVNIQKPAYYGDRIRISTSVYQIKNSYGFRNTNIYDRQGNMVMSSYACGAFIDMKLGKAVAIPKELAASVPVEEKFKGMEYLPRKIRLPKEVNPAVMEGMKVYRYHIDKNDHMNNSNFIQFAQECIPEDTFICVMRGEYKKAAKVKELLIPYMYESGDKFYTISLRDESGDIFANVEFRTV